MASRIVLSACLSVLAIWASSGVVRPESDAPATCVQTVTGERGDREPKPAASESHGNQADVVTGWFTTIWGREALYFLTDDQGQQFSLAIDPELTRPLGGLLAVDRQRVTVTGTVQAGDPPVLWVCSIVFASLLGAEL
ncbi:MAG: hypothetical protein ACKVVP_03565 [Chloroflexota bacterium]